MAAAGIALVLLGLLGCSWGAGLSSAATQDHYCNWNHCDGRVAGGDWCNASESRCLGCGGQWCSKNVPPPPPPDGYCNWNECDGRVAGGQWCNANRGSGGACDAKTLVTPWTNGQNSDYRYAAEYAPLDPSQHGGPAYGEQLWMTGAFSDTLSRNMGADDGCCGTDSEGIGGCGKCVLVTNPTAVNSGWSVLVMKKNRCPPWSSGCGDGQLHLDMAVPGYDNLAFSTANICGQTDTIITRSQSSACGDWYNHGSTTIQGCDCSQIPTGTEGQRMLRAGCQLFTAWGWRSGNPQLTYRVVPCPSAFKQLIGGAFNGYGPTGPR
eukprot:jgi/Mesvir1/13740/Mv11884-RA.1